MDYPKWPASIDYRSLREPWGGSPFRGARETEMEDLNVRSVAEPGANIGTYSWSGILDAAQAQAFETFVEKDLTLGTAPFRMFVTRYGSAYEERVVAMVSKSLKVASAGGPNTLVQFSYRVWPASYLPPAPTVTVGPLSITVTGQPGAPYEVTIG